MNVNGILVVVLSALKHYNLKNKQQSVFPQKVWGVRFTKQVQQTLSLILNSELIYSEIENSEFPVPEQLI